jgi:hypothetical protein
MMMMMMLMLPAETRCMPDGYWCHIPCFVCMPYNLHNYS